MRFALWILLSLVVIPGTALPEDSILSMEYIDTNDGLPQNSVRSVKADHEGYLWVGTEKGLARYDGHGFVDFSELMEDIPKDVSLGIQVDSKNRIWSSWYGHSLRILSSDRSNVMLLEPAKGFPKDLETRIEPIIMELPNGVTWFPGVENIYRLDPDNIVTSINLNSPIRSQPSLIKNYIVVGTMKGMTLIDTNTESIKNVKTPTTPLDKLVDSPAAPLNQVGTEDAILFCTRTGVFKYMLEKEEVSRLSGHTDAPIIACQQLDSNLLIGSRQPQSKNIDLKTLNMDTLQFVPNQSGLPDSINLRFATNPLNSFTDSNDFRWLATGSNLYRAKGDNTSFQRITSPHAPFGLGDIFTEDSSGAVWARTDGYGLARFSLYSRRFSTIKPPVHVVDSERIRSPVVDKDNNVWAINNDQDLLFWNRSNDTWKKIYSFKYTNIKWLETLPDGSIWTIIPHEGKIVGYDPGTDSWPYEYEVKLLAAAFGQSRDGRLILASQGDVFLLSPYSGQMEKITNEPIRGQIRVFTEDAAGGLWVGTHEAGLVRVDISGNLQYWDTSNSDLGSDKIFSVHIGRNQKLWIGTWHGGLNVFDTINNEFTQYDVNSGLPDSTVFGILEDDGGSFWLSTYSGLVKFTPCSNDNCQPGIQTFTQQDGLQGDEFDADSHFRSDRGEFLFSGTGGLNTFYPGLIPINKQAPTVRLSRAQLNDGPLPGALSEFALPGSVQLPFNFGEVRLEVAILDFNTPKKNRFQYRDLKRNDTWKEMQQPYISLRGLSDGAHTFEFRGANNDGVWSTNNAAITLVVAPPYYRHPFMLTLYLLLAILTPVTYFHRKQKRFIRTQASLKKEVAKRTIELEHANKSRERFFANISHEISTPVHMILLMLENHMASVSGEDRKIYKSATGYAAQLMVYLKQLVNEARCREIDNKLYAVEITSIIQQLVESNQPVASSRSISLQIKSLPENRVAFYASSAVSIFSNLLCNALVYTPEKGSIKIAGEVEGDRYTVSISNTISPDQGTDIKSYLTRGSRGTFNANYFGGHGLGLSIVTSGIEILGGTLDVDLLDESTIVFNISLPLAPKNMPVLKLSDDLAFSHEQMLSIKLVNDDDSPPPVKGSTNNSTSVLIVEDDIHVAKLLNQALSRNYQVFVAVSHETAIQLLEKHRPDVILCDLFLPDKSGLEILKTVRSRRMSMDTFFVMMTASVSEEDRLKSQQLAVDRFVRKPVSAESLRLLIENHRTLAAQRLERQYKEELTRKARIENVRNPTLSFKQRFAKALEELYSNPETSIEAIQTRLSMGYSQLMRNCKQHFGQSPKRLLIQKRVDSASELLESSEYSIGYIAEMCGFSSHSQFSIVFKKETGMTPAAFRKSSRKEI